MRYAVSSRNCIDRIDRLDVAEHFHPVRRKPAGTTYERIPFNSGNGAPFIS